jgi:hypothetical protein
MHLKRKEVSMSKRGRHKNSRNTVLALNASYMPMAEIDRRKAIRAVATGRAQFLTNFKTYETTSYISSGQVLKAIVFNPKHDRKTAPRLVGGIKGTRAILRRDGFKCAYCGRKLKSKNGTKDHVVPECQGGLTTWGNLVAACLDCNQRKGGRTPEQAGMVLLWKPTSPLASLMTKFERLVAEDVA